MKPPAIRTKREPVQQLRLWLAQFMWVVFSLCLAAPVWASALTSTVDRTQISINETLNLVVKFEGDRTNSDPDFSALTQQFDVLQNQKSMQHSVVNNQISSSTEWRLTLLPKNTGQLLIPPFALQGQRSQALTIVVKDQVVDPSSGHEDVFIKTSVSQSQSYVQEQIIVTFALYYNRRVDNLDAPELNLDNVRIETLPRVDYQKTLGHSTYGVSEFKYALFPDASGHLSIPSQTWTVRTSDGTDLGRFGFASGRYKLHRAKTEAIDIEVLAKPDLYPASEYWLPAKNLSIEQTWSRDLKEFKVGEPITRTVTIKATGASGEQLPVIFRESNSTDFKFYPDKPKQDSNLTAQGVVGTRTESIAIVPSRGGRLVLPELAVTWWNSASKRIEKATLPAVELNVPEVANANNIAISSTAQAEPTTAVLPTGVNETDSASAWPWQLLSFLLLMSNAALGFIWFRSNKHSGSEQEQNTRAPSNPMQEVLEACKSQSARQVQNSLLVWISANVAHRPATLKTLVILADRPELSTQLKLLEQKLYGDQSVQVNYSVLQQELTDFAKQYQNPNKQEHLAKLYPV